MAQKANWSKWVAENGLREGVLETSAWDFMEACFKYLTFDRQLDLSAARGIGFLEEQENVINGYYVAFDRMRRAKIIP